MVRRRGRGECLSLLDEKRCGVFFEERRHAPLLLFSDGDPEFRRRRKTGRPRFPGDMAHEVEVAVHGVLPHLFGDFFVVEEAAQLLQAVVAELSFSAAEEDDYGALEQTVEVDDQIVRAAPEIPEK